MHQSVIPLHHLDFCQHSSFLLSCLYFSGSVNMSVGLFTETRSSYPWLRVGPQKPLPRVRRRAQHWDLVRVLCRQQQLLWAWDSNGLGMFRRRHHITALPPSSGIYLLLTPPLRWALGLVVIWSNTNVTFRAGYSIATSPQQFEQLCISPPTIATAQRSFSGQKLGLIAG